MPRLIAVLAIALLSAGTALADTASEIRDTYLRFAEAQNARDPARIGAFFIDGPDFLWVSDGRSYRGREDVLARMGSFQRAEIWRVEPHLDMSDVIEWNAEAALLHMPLTLVIGTAAAPNRLEFLVSIVFVRDDADWKIAALLTTIAK